MGNTGLPIIRASFESSSSPILYIWQKYGQKEQDALYLLLLRLPWFICGSQEQVKARMLLWSDTSVLHLIPGSRTRGGGGEEEELPSTQSQDKPNTDKNQSWVHLDILSVGFKKDGMVATGNFVGSLFEQYSYSLPGLWLSSCCLCLSFSLGFPCPSVCHYSFFSPLVFMSFSVLFSLGGEYLSLSY